MWLDDDYLSVYGAVCSLSQSWDWPYSKSIILDKTLVSDEISQFKFNDFFNFSLKI